MTIGFLSIDNIYADPYLVRDHALSCEYFSEKTSSFILISSKLSINSIFFLITFVIGIIIFIYLYF